MNNSPTRSTASKLTNDLNDILDSTSDYKPTIEIELKLHTEEKDLTTADGIVLGSILQIRDYENNVADYTEVKLIVYLGTYVYDIYPNLSNIEVTLIYYDQLYEGDKPAKVVERYKAVYLKDLNAQIPTLLNASMNDLNQQAPITLTLQLLDRSAEVIRVATVQGNFEPSMNGGKKPDVFLRTIISDQGSKITIENKPAIQSIDIEKADNVEDIPSITLPSFTRIVDLPGYLQNRSYGIYNAGIGAYLQLFNGLKTFFIYSLYSAKKYDKQDYKTIFYSPMDSSLVRVDKTYLYRDKILKVIVEPLTKVLDSKETDLMSSGAGFRVSNARSFMRKPVDMTEEGPRFNRPKLNTEIVLKDRKDGLNYAPHSDQRTSANNFKRTTEVVKSNGAYIELKWYNSNIRYIYPGQACKIMVEDKENKITEIYGVILSIQTYTVDETQSPVLKYNQSTNYSTVSVIKVFVTNF
jgi:hypothetical protein